MNRRAFLAMPALALLPATGCSGGTGSIRGKVLNGNRPVILGNIAFYGEGPAAASFGSDIQPDGSYEIASCPNGRYKVCVTSPNPDQSPEAGPSGRANDPRDKVRSAINARANPGAAPPPAPPPVPVKTEGWFEIPSRFSDPDNSGLFVEVSGATEYDVPLTSS